MAGMAVLDVAVFQLHPYVFGIAQQMGQQEASSLHTTLPATALGVLLRGRRSLARIQRNQKRFSGSREGGAFGGHEQNRIVGAASLVRAILEELSYVSACSKKAEFPFDRGLLSISRPIRPRFVTTPSAEGCAARATEHRAR